MATLKLSISIGAEMPELFYQGDIGASWVTYLTLLIGAYPGWEG